MSDPYRSGTGLTCPSCSDVLLLAEASFVCPRQCGEWVELAALRAFYPHGDLGSIVHAHREQRSCAMCRNAMELRRWGAAPFELCGVHGIWIDDSARAMFHEQVAGAFAMERKINELAAQLSDPANHRKLAIRFLEHERRIEQLEAVMARLGSYTTEV